MPPGRPTCIVSDCNSISKNIAGFIDYHIQCYANQHPTSIYDFIDKIRNVSIPENSLLITLDVESMYTNIYHNKGILAVKEALNNFYLSDYITELLELSLRTMTFSSTTNGSFKFPARQWVWIMHHTMLIYNWPNLKKVRLKNVH